MRQWTVRRWTLGLAALAAAAAFTGCDQQRAAKLEPGVATEADLVREFGQPTRIIEKADGTKVYEYPRQPEGVTNYRALIGTDGRLTALTQQLTPGNFAQVQPGMSQAAVRNLLGPPAKTERFDLKPGEEHWHWRFEASGGQRRVFSVTFDRAGVVQASAIGDDPRDTQIGGR